jgi:outer membrane protein assembly factor BamA
VTVRCLLLAACFAAIALADRFPLESMSADGVAIPASTLAELSGLKPGDLVDESAFQAAVGKLQSTGLFREVTFRYRPGPKRGFILEFHFAPAAPQIAAIIDIPGVDPATVKNCVRTRYPWIEDRIPPGPDAEAFVTHAIETCAAHGAIITEIEGDLQSGKTALVFRPKDLPRVVALRFAGNKELAADQLQRQLSTTAMNSEFTERRFRQLLELNLRPLYEEHGMLKLKFAAVSSDAAPGGVAANSTIEEGLVYKLAAVNIEGADLPDDVSQAKGKFARGKMVVWSEILKSITETERPLQRTGYIQTRASTRRDLDDAAAVLNLTVHIDKGRQFFFNSLSIEGLPDAPANRARREWRLESGSPMNSEYMIEYQKALFQIPDFKGLKIKFGMRAAGADRVDVVVSGAQ